ncbi:MAG: prepilin peptidase [Clostridiales bacterium]|nr:prepilin peptidase [Clostridiales bacterium]
MDNAIEIIILISLILVGLCIGSFLNVLIYRLPLSMSIITPSSHCPSCKQKIKWYDNIPLLSYIILGGKCRHCKSKISFRYFAVELINLILWIVVLLLLRLSFYSVIYLFTASILLAIVFIDAKHQIIPDSLNIALAVLGTMVTVYSIFDPNVVSLLGHFTTPWWEHLIGGFGGGLLFAGIYYIYLLIRKKEGLGGGDIKFIATIGFILGYKLTLLTIGFSAIIACFYLLIKRLAGKLEADKPFAYGPFLASAAFIALLFGDYLINLYISLF